MVDEGQIQFIDTTDLQVANRIRRVQRKSIESKGGTRRTDLTAPATFSKFMKSGRRNEPRASESGAKFVREQNMDLKTTSRPLNGFLSALSAEDFELVRPHLRTIALEQEMVLIEAGETLTRAFLPHHGVISLVVNLAKGERVQAAMIGRDSIFGAFSAFGDQIALDNAVVLVPGTASTLDLDRLRAAAEQSSNIRSLLVRHGLAIHAQILHTAGCNAVHTVESRLARCLSQTHDLSGDFRLDLTQEALAQMIGARRNSVSLVASTLQQSNFIRYSRGRIDITNLDGLRTTACECYPVVKAQYERLLRVRSPH